MVLRTFIAVHCTYIHYRLKKKREGRYKMDGMRGEKERYNRDGSEREEGKVREGCECGGEEGTRGMGVKRKKGWYEIDGSARVEGKVQERWE